MPSEQDGFHPRLAALATGDGSGPQYHLYFTNLQGQIFQICKPSQGPFQSGIVTAPGAPPAVGNPAVMVTSGQQHVFYRVAPDNGASYIYHIWRNADGSMHGGPWTLGGAPAPVSDPTAVPYGDQQHVFFRSQLNDGRLVIYHIYRSGDGTMHGEIWTTSDAPAPEGDPSAVATPGQLHVFYRAKTSNGTARIYQTWGYEPGSLQTGIWTAHGAPDPVGDPSALITGGQQHVFYRGASGPITQIWRDPNGDMNQGPWTAPGAPLPATDPSAFLLMGTYQAVAYSDDQNEPYLLFLDEGKLRWEWVSYQSKPKNIPLPQMMNLLQTYSPRVWLHSHESFMPSSVPFAFLHMTRELRDTKLGQTYCLRTNQRWIGDINPPNPPTGFPQYFLGDLNGAVVYAFFVDKLGRNTDLTYFFFYPFNRGFGGFGNHVSDWEHCTVRLEWSKSGDEWTNPAPIAVAGSAHTENNYVTWDKIEKVGTHPVIYSAKGTHANYFSSGTHFHDKVIPDFCDRGTSWDTWLKGMWAYYWDPSNYPLEIGRDYKATPLNGIHWPQWLGSSKYSEPGNTPSSPDSGPIYRWGNPFSLIEFIGDSITGPIDKDEVWLPWTFG